MHIDKCPKQGSVDFIRFPKITHQLCRKLGEKLRNFTRVTSEFLKKFNFDGQFILKLHSHYVQPSSF